MDPNHYVVDPEGGIILSVEEHPGYRLHLNVLRTPEKPSDPSALLSHQHNNGDRVIKLRALVSSKHLTLASKPFRAKLDTMLDLGESDILPTPCSTDALLMLLGILHCQTRKVPRSIKREMLLMELFKLTTEFAVRCNMWRMSEWSPSSIHHD
ncbi:hypothetical protein N8T08_006398 [Aspergillus melleus]|uniref:Uncharacterized protein n=1 Tax=Aspergillus melleus TaxID=138277 RepID=A0ACC3BFA9_9EURO|nr:hypothetical protein N8T08_006398 [Aspergillus melleus]